MDMNDRRKMAAAEAAEWWLALQGEISRDEREQYVDWLRESSSHVAEMLYIAQIHRALEQFEQWSRVCVDGTVAQDASVVRLAFPETASRSHPRRAWLMGRVRWAVAAALVVMAAASVFLLTDRSQLIQTARGERREVELQDGSVVHVDPETRLRVRYETNVRNVSLERGRAFFRVAKNPNRAFIVRAQGTLVRAVGTAFAVERNADSNSVVVTVAEGKVSVADTKREYVALDDTRPHSTAAGVPSAGAPGRDPAQQGKLARLRPAAAIYLTANQQLTVDGSESAEAVREVDSSHTLAWVDGHLIFDNDPVQYAVQQFNRYNRIKIYVRDHELSERRISGVFNAADPESFIAFIKGVSAVQITRTDPDIIVEKAK